MTIRIVPDGMVPLRVIRILWPGERRVVSIRKSPAVYLDHALLMAAILAVFGLDAAAVIKRNWFVLAILIVVFAGLSFSMFRRVYRGIETYFCVTGKRIILLGWRRGRELEVIPIADASYLVFRRPLRGRVFGYGTFIIPGPDGRRSKRKITYLPYPEQLYVEVCGILFPDPGPEFDLR